MTAAAIGASCPQAERANIDPLTVFGVPRAGIFIRPETVMAIALPPNWLSTDDAIDDLRTADAEWKELHAAREATLAAREAVLEAQKEALKTAGTKPPIFDKDSPEYVIYRKAGERFLDRTHQLTADVIASIAARELVAVWLVEVNPYFPDEPLNWPLPISFEL